MGNARDYEAWKRYGSLFEDVSAVLLRVDPMGINFESNKDEYDPETRTILPRLKECQSEADALKVIHSEFQQWFAHSAGPESRYVDVAKEIWALWQGRAAGR